jgi:hypothetical protein
MLKSFIICTDEIGKLYTMKEKEVHTKFCFKNMKEIDHMEDLGIGGKLILKWILSK